MIIYLFGATTLSGQAFINEYKKNFFDIDLITFSRTNKKNKILDFDDAENFIQDINDNYLIVSFAPIWKLADYLNRIFLNKPHQLKGLKGILACSSSSIYTKKFAANKFDQYLYLRLYKSERILSRVTEEYNAPLCILEPTMIYGNIERYKDKNVNLLSSFLKNFPFIFIPSNTGKRQPIHASQLAKLAIKKIEYFINFGDIKFEKVPIGGDEIITFEELLFRINNVNLNKKVKILKCYIFRIPNRIFYFLLSPLIIFSPKYYEAFLRLSSDLSGFPKASHLLNIKENKFPIIDKDF